MKFPDPVRASDVTKHDRGRHRAVKNRRTWWQVLFAWKHTLFLMWQDIKTEWECLRRDWFTWKEN